MSLSKVVRGETAIRLLVKYLPEFRGRNYLILKLANTLNKEWPEHVNYMTPTGLRYDLNLSINGHRHLFFLGHYEADVTWIIDNLLVEGDEVIEAGTDIGLHTIRAASKVAPHGCIHGFDPLKSAILDTQRHIEMNKLHNITLNQLALGPNEGTGTIYSFPDMPRGHSCLKNLEGVTSLANDCLVTTIDQYVKSKFIKKIKLIKLDIEGSELPALLGASETITNFHPIVVAEVNFDTSAAFGYRPKDLIDFFNNFSYHCYIYRNRKWIELLREGDIKTGDNLLFIWKHDSSSLSTIK